MYKLKARATKRAKRRARITPKVLGTAAYPRLTIFRSNKYIYGQIIDDTKGVVLAAFSSQTVDKGTKIAQATQAGVGIAKKALEQGIKKVKFDRSGYKYHGRVKSFADAVRSEGVQL